MSQISKCPKLRVVLGYWEALGEVSELRYNNLLYSSSKRSYCSRTSIVLKCNLFCFVVLFLFKNKCVFCVILHNLELFWPLATCVRALRGFDTNSNETASRKVYTGPCWPLATTGACSRQSSRDQDVGWATQGTNTCVSRYRNALLKVNLLWIHGRTEAEKVIFSHTLTLCWKCRGTRRIVRMLLKSHFKISG